MADTTVSSDSAAMGGGVVSWGTTHDGLVQLRRRWEVDTPRASLLLVHGIGEHSGRYLHVGDALAAAGIDTLAFDNRGFGRSGGVRAYVESFDHFVEDIDELLAERRSLGVPVVLLGHSLGGLMAATHLVSDRPDPDLAVLSAPALHAVVPRWQRLAVPVLSRIRPRFRVEADFDGSILSRDAAIQRRYDEDPLRVSGTTAALGRHTLAAMRSTSSSLGRIDVPTYVLHGSDDELVPSAASEPLANLPNVTRRVWPGLRHECFNEPERDLVLAEMIAWIDGQLADLR